MRSWWQGLLVEAFFQAFFQLYWQRLRLNCSAINVLSCPGCFSVFLIATSSKVCSSPMVRVAALCSSARAEFLGQFRCSSRVCRASVVPFLCFL